MTGVSDMTELEHLPHYTCHPVFSGEPIDVAQYCDFVTGNAVKYLWRCTFKGQLLEDLVKSADYVRNLPAPCTPIIPQSVVDRLAGEADPFLEDHESDVLWLTVAAIMHLVRRQHQDAADLVNLAIGRVS